MGLFNRNRVPDLHSSADWQEDEEQEQQDTDHEGQYYCGICGWVDIDLFPNCH